MREKQDLPGLGARFRANVGSREKGEADSPTQDAQFGQWGERKRLFGLGSLFPWPGPTNIPSPPPISVASSDSTRPGLGEAPEPAPPPPGQSIWPTRPWRLPKGAGGGDGWKGEVASPLSGSEEDNRVACTHTGGQSRATGKSARQATGLKTRACSRLRLRPSLPSSPLPNEKGSWGPYLAFRGRTQEPTLGLFFPASRTLVFIISVEPVA